VIEALLLNLDMKFLITKWVSICELHNNPLLPQLGPLHNFGTKGNFILQMGLNLLGQEAPQQYSLTHTMDFAQV
jgi:hypothetical protein